MLTENENYKIIFKIIKENFGHLKAGQRVLRLDTSKAWSRKGKIDKLDAIEIKTIVFTLASFSDTFISFLSVKFSSAKFTKYTEAKKLSFISVSGLNSYCLLLGVYDWHVCGKIDTRACLILGKLQVPIPRRTWGGGGDFLVKGRSLDQSPRILVSGVVEVIHRCTSCFLM